MGQNGVGKSLFAKDLYINQNKLNKKIGLIGSYTNIPDDITYQDLLSFLKETFDISKIEKLASYLGIDNINHNILLKKLSDGQKQKIKLLTFLLLDYEVLILDEITNALDKKTIQEIYKFFNKYINENPDICILNITHNLMDINYLNGNYYLIENHQIIHKNNKDELITTYINGD